MTPDPTQTLTVTQAVDHTEALHAMQSRRFRIPGDIVNKATADLNDAQRSAVRWLHAHAAENDLPLAEIGKLIRYDESTVHRVFHGKYEGNLAKVCAEIEAFRALHTERSKGRKLEFIETTLAKRIWKVCDNALEYQRVGFIFGESQTGKTVALEKYRDDHNHGSTIYVRMPTGGSLCHFLAVFARALRMSSQLKEKELQRRIIEAFDDRMLLIVDEIHQCCYARSESGAKAVEFIRELYDASACGIVLCGTKVFEQDMEGGKFAKILRQIKRRRLCKMMLPDIPTADDLNIFAAAYNLPPAAGDFLKLQTEVIKEEALGMWLTLLRMAAKMAAKKNQKMTWAHVASARAGLRHLEGN